MAERLAPRGYCFLEHCPTAQGIEGKAAGYAHQFNITVVHIPNGRGYDIFVPTDSFREIQDELRELRDVVEEARLNDLAMEEFNRAYPDTSVTVCDDDEGLSRERAEAAEDWARSEEDGWYYAD